jgi:putative ABC transport system permease protein
MWRKRKRLDRDFDDEIQAHLDLETARLRQEGLTDDDARSAALRGFGNVTTVRERFYESARWTWLDQALRDLRYGARRLLKDSAFSLGVVFLLALGIGATTAIFSIVYAVLLHPLPYPDASRIVSVETFWKNTGRPSRAVSAPDFDDWQSQNSTLARMAYHYGDELTTIVDGRAEYANVELVTPEFFAVFGQTAVAGRLFTDREQQAPLMVVSFSWAVSHFGSADAAPGQTMTVDGRAGQIVGVAPPGFHYPDKTDIWQPAGIVPVVRVRTVHNYAAVGLLKPGVPLASAREELRVIGNRLAAAYPNDNRLKTVALTPLQDRLTKGVQTTLWVLMGAVAVVLLIACANIANLLLARAATRTREVALRVALGASRGRVARQLLTEYLLLAAVAAVAGLALAQLVLRLLVAMAPAGLPRLNEVAIDRPVLLFALAASLVSTLLFGLAPALHASRLDLTDSLKQGGAKGAVTGGSGRLRSTLVAIEVALSVMLLVSAGLLLRSFQALHRVDLGLSIDRVLTVDASLSGESPEDRRRAARFYQDLIDRVRQQPGVTQAGGGHFVPFGSGGADSAYFIEGRPAPPPGEWTSADIQVVTPGYFQTLRVPLRAGRDFSESDTEEAPLVVIVNEALARAAFPGGNALGQRLKTGYALSTFKWMEIVGVAADARRIDPGRPPRAELFIPYRQHPTSVRAMSVLARTRQEPETMVPLLRDVLRQLNPEVPVRFATMDEAFAQSLAYPRFRTVLVSAFAGLAVLLALVGLFSVLAYLVGQRTKEFAVRFAMGARTMDVVRLVLREGLRLVGVGVVFGIAGALALSRLLKGLLYGVSAWDPGTYAAIVALLVTAALLACVLPAWRAAAVNPLVSLRHD